MPFAFELPRTLLISSKAFNITLSLTLCFFHSSGFFLFRLVMLLFCCVMKTVLRSDVSKFTVHYWTTNWCKVITIYLWNTYFCLYVMTWCHLVLYNDWTNFILYKFHKWYQMYFNNANNRFRSPVPIMNEVPVAIWSARRKIIKSSTNMIPYTTLIVSLGFCVCSLSTVRHDNYPSDWMEIVKSLRINNKSKQSDEK